MASQTTPNCEDFFNIIASLAKFVLRESAANISQERLKGLSEAEQFDVFIQTFNRSYENEAERAMRFGFFQQTLKDIEILQSEEMGTATYGINLFSDMSNEEFLQKYATTYSYEESEAGEKDVEFFENIEDSLGPPSPSPPSDSFDWLEEKVIPPARDQGKQCAADWAFASVGTLEVMVSVVRETPVSLSVQELVDCAIIEKGCKGGTPTHAFYYMQRMGVTTEELYKYTGTQGECASSRNNEHHKIKRMYERKADQKQKMDNEMYLKNLLPKFPATARIHPGVLKNYKNGISHPSSMTCPKKFKPDRKMTTVLVLGYGNDEGKKWMRKKVIPYWKLRLSFGPEYGEQGNIRIFRGDNVCGIGNWLTWATYLPPE